MGNVVGENRRITHISSTIVVLLMTGIFIVVWMSSYNQFAFRSHQELGAFFSILAWVIFYLKFCQIYGALKIASNAISEIGFSQFLSIGFSDLILYVAVCLAGRYYINIWPGVIAVIVQIVTGFVWATLSKRYFLNHVDPNKCLLIYDAAISDGERVCGKEFSAKIEKYYGHLFEIVECEPVSDEMEMIYRKIDEYPITFIYDMPLEKRSRIIGYCVNQGKRFYVTPTVEDIIARGYDVKHFIDTPLMAYNGSFKVAQTYLGKRVMDIVFSLFFIILTSPIMLLTAAAIKIEDGGDVFFRQDRVGQGGKIFKILKFRSMIMDAEKDGIPKPCVTGDSRITKVGKILRSTRLDELPQLFNVLRGEISLVGPRPERTEHVELYTKELPEFRYRLRVQAGLTGYAQIYGKYNTSARDKLLLDLIYIEQQSFLLDLRIVFLTVKIMFIPESTEGFDEKKSKAINKKSQQQMTL